MLLPLRGGPSAVAGGGGGQRRKRVLLLLLFVCGGALSLLLVMAGGGVLKGTHEVSGASGDPKPASTTEAPPTADDDNFPAAFDYPGMYYDMFWPQRGLNASNLIEENGRLRFGRRELSEKRRRH